MHSKSFESDSKEGETLDEIVWRHYGAEIRGALETVIEANQGIAALGPILPLGTRLLLPVIDAPKEAESLRLWD
ncbi:tail protein X [Phaeobacter sp. CAU 1743]|uniref:tail protein X n=1 Tax=Phaeobacter sp. CAU 1743 TaxID=3140367 RepID=UPI00325B516D